MPLIDVVCPDGSVEQISEEDGVTIPVSKVNHVIPGKDLKAHLQVVRNLPIRDDDVFIATYPKAGTHWSWEIVSMLLKGKPDYETKVKETAMLEFRTQEEIESLPSPRILNSHNPVHLIPQEMMTKKTKIIHVIRNPKDVVVSRYNHFKSIKGMQSPLVKDFSTFLKFNMGEFGPHEFYPYYKYVLEWEKFAEANPDQVLTLYYEDMKEDSVREIKKMAVFLDTGADDKLIEQIAEACGFENLKKADSDVKSKDNPNKKEQGPSMMYRKGEVGDWKNWFTVADNERHDEWLSENLVDTKLRIRYQL